MFFNILHSPSGVVFIRGFRWVNLSGPPSIPLETYFHPSLSSFRCACLKKKTDRGSANIRRYFIYNKGENDSWTSTLLVFFSGKFSYSRDIINKKAEHSGMCQTDHIKFQPAHN